MNDENISIFEEKAAGVDNSTTANVTPLNKKNMRSQMGSESTVRPYTFRRLNATDLFPMIKIISKIGLDELSQVFDGDSIKDLIGQTKNIKSGDAEEKSYVVGIGVAMKLVNKIIEHIPRCEQDIYSLLSRVSGMSVEEIQNLGVDVFMMMILDFVMKEEFKDFFKAASSCISRSR